MKLFPSIQGTLGSWKYYSTKMSGADLSSQVKFASEVWESNSLDLWIQRALNSNRAKDEIAGYLARHDDRFFNSIVVAAIEGDPKFFPVQITDDPQFALIADKKMNSAFGVLRFNGDQKYYALDGQHRLMAIKKLIENETPFSPPAGFADEEFSVIIVVQKEEETRDEFMKKYRRLFSHLNRHAKPMDKATTIIMEEDDAFAIITRRLIQEHPFFSWVEDGESTRVRCAGSENMGEKDPHFISIITLYKMTITLLTTPARRNDNLWGADGKDFQKLRPSDEELEALYDEVKTYWDSILEVLPDLINEPREMRNNVSEDCVRDDETITNHLFFRPIGQELLAGLVRQILDDRLPDLDNFSCTDVKTAIAKIGQIDWRLFQEPWKDLLFVYDRESGKSKMRSEERKNASSVALNIAKWLVGLGTNNEEEILYTYKEPWRNLLLDVSDEEAEEMWDKIIEIVVELRD